MTTDIEQKLHEIRRSLPLRWETPETWTTLALGNLNSFLADHASCERKAGAAALMLANRYPEHPELQDRMIGLAIEEMQHFHQVFKLLKQRNIPLPNDDVDPYVKALLVHVRHPRQEHLLDRLLVAAMIEARSCERFCLFTSALPTSDLKAFYIDFSLAESAHVPLFIKTAELFFPVQDVSDRLSTWMDIEAKAAQSTPLAPRIH